MADEEVEDNWYVLDVSKPTSFACHVSDFI
jgi:hypothetical protein